MLIINGKMMLRQGGQVISPGAVVDLPDKVAESLIKVGLAEKAKKGEVATMPKAENAMMPPPIEKQVNKEYENMTKNQLVRELNIRGIEHNKRQVKAELIALLRGD